MAKHTIWNIGKANAEISAADSAINPLLEAAKITTLKVNGADVPASDAPLADKILGLASVSKPGAGTQDVSELIATNDSVARQLTETSDRLAVSNASVAKLQLDNSKLTSDLATAQASVSTLTASNAELQNRHDASIRQVGDLTKQANSVNADVSRQCLEYGCLDLTDTNGHPLAKNATGEECLAAANRIPIADKLKACKGAVNAAMAKTGLSFATLPTGAPNAQQTEKKAMTATERCKSDVEARQRNGTLTLPAQQR